MRRRLALAALAAALGGAPAAAAPGAQPAALGGAPAAAPGAQPAALAPAGDQADDGLARYFAELEAAGLVDVETGTLQTLRRDLAGAEALLRDGAVAPAAVALYGLVRSPRYAAFADFVEFQNAEYDLAVALARAGAPGAALGALDAALRRGPSAPYWGPAHRRAVDVALETRDHAGVLARLEAIPSSRRIPPSAAGERAYLRGRAAYDAGRLDDAEAVLATVSRQSRLYSSAVYLRGVLRARRGDYRAAADAMCGIAGTPDDDRFAFVVDERYFTLKDLARLGLGRLAHEQGEYDDAYYHDFQIPEDSAYLPDALFEAAWSMYQKRELATARDLVRELLRAFPTSPLWPEASLLAGYVELADCKFDGSQAWYDRLVARVAQIVAELDALRRDPARRSGLFARALRRDRERRLAGEPAGGRVGGALPATVTDEVLALLRLDPRFVRLDEAVVGLRALAGEAAAGVQQWTDLAERVATAPVARVSAAPDAAATRRADAGALVEDLRRLVAQARAQRAALGAARAGGRVRGEDADAEDARLAALVARAEGALARAAAVDDAAAAAVAERAAPGLRPLLLRDVADARRLERAAHAAEARLAAAADRLAAAALDRLHADTRRVLDKARLGKIDAVIGQKRRLDIDVQELAAGRLPAELVGRLWSAGTIGDDEELWPQEGEFWADEYEGWR